MIRLVSLILVLLLIGCGGEEERLKVQRDISKLQEQLYELERNQALIREQVAQTNADIKTKLEDRSSQAEMKDRMFSLQESLSQYEARILDLERQVTQLSRNSRTVVSTPVPTPDPTDTTSTSDYIPSDSVSGSDVQKLFDRSMLDLNRGKADAAMLGFETIISNFPDSELVEDAHYYSGKAAYGNKDWPKAVQHFELVANKVGRGKYTRQGLFYLGRVYYNMNSHYKSVLTLRDVISKYPGTQEADLAKDFLRNAGYEK